MLARQLAKCAYETNGSALRKLAESYSQCKRQREREREQEHCLAVGDCFQSTYSLFVLDQ